MTTIRKTDKAAEKELHKADKAARKDERQAVKTDKRAAREATSDDADQASKFLEKFSVAGFNLGSIFRADKTDGKVAAEFDKDFPNALGGLTQLTQHLEEIAMGQNVTSVSPASEAETPAIEASTRDVLGTLLANVLTKGRGNSDIG